MNKTLEDYLDFIKSHYAYLKPNEINDLLDDILELIDHYDMLVH